MVDEKTLIEPVAREALYALVWAEPMLRVAARYNVSSSYLARVCTLMNVPRPERGYWAGAGAAAGDSDGRLRKTSFAGSNK